MNSYKQILADNIFSTISRTILPAIAEYLQNKKGIQVSIEELEAVIGAPCSVVRTIPKPRTTPNSAPIVAISKEDDINPRGESFCRFRYQRQTPVPTTNGTINVGKDHFCLNQREGVKLYCRQHESAVKSRNKKDKVVPVVAQPHKESVFITASSHYPGMYVDAKRKFIIIKTADNGFCVGAYEIEPGEKYRELTEDEIKEAEKNDYGIASYKDFMLKLDKIKEQCSQQNKVSTDNIPSIETI